MSGISQVFFEGSPILVDSLYSANGQNYLVIHPHRKILAFTEEQSGSTDQGSIYRKEQVVVDDVPWEVFTFQDPLVEEGMTSPVGFDGDNMIFSEVVFDRGIYKGALKMASPSGKIQEVSVPYFKNKAPIQSGCISMDGRFMILSAESSNSYGVEDLYVSKRNADGTWSSLKNLGFKVNTAFQEITPFLAADNKTLFFATNGREGAGSFDIYFTIRQDDSWRNWSTPVNLGFPVNTNGAETSFVFQDGAEWAWFVSSKDSDGYGDVYRIKFKEDIEADTAQLIEEAVVMEDTTPVIESIATPLVQIKVVDAKTGESLPSQLISSEGTKENVNGLFVIDSLNGKEVQLKAAGYLPVMVMLDEQLKEGENVVALNSISRGNTIALEHVLFHRGTSRLVDGSEKELDLVVEIMNENPNIKILLKGHTDNTGDPVKNVRLSEDRVRSVKQYLLDKGISPYRVTGKGFGGNQPIASNETEETRKLNRRVEFEVIED
ncbi:MAG: hypothetical protein Tsb0034_01690 [Ekhidna sp.]